MVVCMPTTVAGGGWKCYDFCGRWGFNEAQASILSIPVQTPNPVDLTECTQSRHAGAGQPNRLDGLVSLAEVIPADSLGVGKRLPDDVVEFRVHADMKARPKPKEKPRRLGHSHAGLST